MATSAPSAAALPRRASPFQSRRSGGRIGDGILYGLCAFASLMTVVILGLIAYQIVHGASPAISKFGLGFITDNVWKANDDIFGARTVIYGSGVASGIALLLATPLGIAIGLYLALLTSGRVRAVIGPLVETLAAVPSVILGFWGILILAPFVKSHLEPWLHGNLGFIPLFGPPQTTGISVFTGSLILTIMIVPIIASISRDL